ncbi:MAG: alkaline phosphatase D family protein, partial [Brachybacterium tyrofermentans]
VLHALAAEGTRLPAGRCRRGLGAGADGRPISLRGPWASAETDFTARISAKQLPAGTTFETELFFEDENGHRGEVGSGRFSTAPGDRSDGAQTFV